MEVKEFIDKIAVVGDSNIPEDDGKIYYSKTDGSYLTRVGLEEGLEFLMERGITENIQSKKGGKTACLGFSPSEQKWYGWSHRAIFGFGIGSTCKQGDCGFKPSNKEEFIKRQLEFWVYEENAEDDTVIVTEVEGGVIISYIYNNTVPNESLRGTRYTHFCPYPKEWGRGEWEATTLDEAKEMALNFSRSVS